uniref:Uncharacterized protein n=1 Tax=Octopus bimaculoides TaxID=37653 RepID=A0A0L8FSR3_OCTBM
MLEIHTALKEDLDISSTEMVYGALITVLGESISSTKSDLNAKRYMEQLRDNMGQLCPTSMSTHSIPWSSVPNGLHKMKFVYTCCDAR